MARSGTPVRPGRASRLRLTVVLRDVAPRVWRELDVDPGITFAELHDAIQRAMGWKDCHLHEFSVGPVRIGRPDHDEFYDAPSTLDERRLGLADAIGGVRRFEYWYDFGDDWRHDIDIGRREATSDEAPGAVLVAGGGACPPEDCGGSAGYEDLLAVLRDPAHPEYEDTRAWAGKFDPDRFDLAAAQRRVARKFAPRSKPR